MRKFKLLNNLVGWGSFAIAFAVYLLTLEPTASLWDCGEFIACSYKLQIGHPPGAPLFLMLGRIFSLFAYDKAHVAVMVNSLSALASAFTVMFLFWTITRLLRKILRIENDDISNFQTGFVLISGLVGALAFAFSDSFWFSAVEAEVYGMSSLFTALVFWAVLKWEEEADEPWANRWLVLIAYLVGLSVGVHLLNLLAIPAIVTIVYYKKYPDTKFIFWKSLGISIMLLLLFMYVVIPGIVKVAGWFELFFVNLAGLPFNSGVIIYAVLLFTGIVWLLYYSYTQGKAILNTVVLCVAVVIIGYSSYAMIVIRSVADTPLNEDKPDNVFSLYSYLNRDQYGDNPLIYGPNYDAKIIESKRDNPVYVKKDGKYAIVAWHLKYVYDGKHETFFPRMYSQNPGHIESYKYWATVKNSPTFLDNVEFFFKYQLGYLYFRYFMWNFTGKQNNLQGNGGILRGNWITGFDGIDKHFIGSQVALPPHMKDNPGTNRYFLLPLIVGIIGWLFISNRHKRYSSAIFLLFFFTGIAIEVYLNQTPNQARERDYAYVGSFYAYCIWIGIGAYAIVVRLQKAVNRKFSGLLASLLVLGLPALLLIQNWDDHDRSSRYIARDFAYNYLNSCAKSAVLFTIGDNDTYPLWYLQEVEGIRTDIKTCNMNLLNADWYIDMVRKKTYNADGLPVALRPDQYITGERQRIYVFDSLKKALPIAEALFRLETDSVNYKSEQTPGVLYEYLPGNKIAFPVNKQLAVSSGALTVSDAPQAEDSVIVSLTSSTLSKSNVMVLETLGHSGWKRPVYFTGFSYHTTPLGVESYMQLDGFTYQWVPIYSETDNVLKKGRVETEVLYNNVMNIFKWGGLEKGTILMDGYIKQTIGVARVRNVFARLALALVADGKPDAGKQVLDRCMFLLPIEKLPFDANSTLLADAYFKCGARNEAVSLATKHMNQLLGEMEYFYGLPRYLFGSIDYERGLDESNARSLYKMLMNNGEVRLAQSLKQGLDRITGNDFKIE